MLADALAIAYPQWEKVIRELGLGPAALALAYAFGAAACWSNGLAAGDRDGDGRAWFAAAGALALIGINTVLRLDLLAIYLLRAVSRADGWYARRRDVQFLMVGFVAFAGLVALGWLRTRLAAAWSRHATIVLGVLLLVGVAVLRAVSFHYTDLFFNLRVAGVTAGRFLEVAGLGLAGAGALRCARVAA
jgi:hypothetical protein